MDTDTALTEDLQYRLVYTAICGIASNCDGAVEQDQIGFDGTDTTFGRRIASFPFESWTEEIKAEAARIIDKYRAQARSHGVDVTTLDVVVRERGERNHVEARITARHMARQAERMVEVTHRIVEPLEGGGLTLSWHKRDPEFNGLVEAARACPGRSWDAGNRQWVLPLSRQAAELVTLYQFPVKGALAKAIRSLLAAEPDKVYNVRLAPEYARVIIRAPYDANRLVEARALPGRVWDGVQKVDVVDLCPALLDFARRWALSIDPLVEQALTDGVGVVADPLPTLLRQVSTCADPAELPAAFIALLS